MAYVPRWKQVLFDAYEALPCLQVEMETVAENQNLPAFPALGFSPGPIFFST